MAGTRGARFRAIVATLLAIAMAADAVVERAFAFGSRLQDASTTISLATPIERALSAGQSHNYRVDVPAGAYAHVTVEQRGIDLAVTLSGPAGEVLSEIDSPTAERGSESVSIVAAAAGTFAIRVAAPAESIPPAGSYALTLDALRPATAQDTVRVAAERDSHAALQLWNEQTDSAMKAATERYEKALASWRAAGDRRGEAETLSNLGSLAVGTDQVQRAIDLWRLERAIRKELADKSGEAIAASNIGSAFDAVGNLQRALDHYREAEELAAASGDPLARGQALSESGRVLVRMGRLSEAEASLNEALPLLLSKVDAIQLGQVYGALGSVAYKRSDRPLARERYGKSLEYFTTADDASRMSSALLYIGLTVGDEGRREEALVYFRRALELSSSVDDARGLVTIQSAIGSTYDYLGDRDEAIVHYAKALADATKLDDRIEVGNALNNIGVAMAVRNDFAARDVVPAVRYLQRAISVRQAAGDVPGVGDALLNLGLVRIRSGASNRALSDIRRALGIHRSVGNRANEAQSLKLLGDAYAAGMNWRRAMSHYEEARPLARNYGFAGSEATVLLGMARAERGRGNLNAARSRIEEAIRIVESVRGRIANRDLRASYFAAVQSYYEFYIDLLMQAHAKDPTRGYDAEALRIAERARARSLLDLLQASGADNRAGTDPTLAVRLEAIQSRLDAATRRQIAAGAVDADAAEAARAEVEELAREYDQILGTVRASDPRFAALTGVEPLTVPEIQQQVLDDETVLVEYALGETRSYAWVVTPTSIRSFTLGPRASIEAAVREVHALATSPTGLVGTRGLALAGAPVADAKANVRERAIRAFAAAGLRLNERILNPLSSAIGSKRVLVVADGALAYLPFAALPEPGSTADKYVPLIVKREVVNAPSASTIAIVRRERAARPVASKTLAVFADPVFDSSDERVKRPADAPPAGGVPDAVRGLGLAHVYAAAKDVDIVGTENHVAFRRLAATRREAEAIARLVPAENSTIALDFSANRTMALGPEVADYRYLHFATHGFADSTRPVLSGLLLSLCDENGNDQSGFLRLGDVFGMRLGADLVVLSACETGLGKQVRGEGIVGLTRGFMYAGAPRVVVSLWSVNDSATADLMVAFYDGMLAKGLSPSAALRAAQLKLFSQDRTRAPFYWAPFILQGDWR